MQVGRTRPAELIAVRCGMESGTHLKVQVTEPGDIDWEVEEEDWAVDY